jgi:exonuclease III
MSFRVCTWNVNWFDRETQVEDRVRLLTDLDPDAVALQEVRGYQAREYGLGPSVFASEFLPDKNTSQMMISGLVFRQGTVILDKGLVPMPEREQRSAWARVQLAAFPTPITFVSWHSQHGAGLPAEYKMGYFTAMSAWLVAQSGPLVLGADINTHMDPVDLLPPDPSDDYAEEHGFVGVDPEHKLRDAYRTVLEDKGLLSELRKSKPEGPLAISHAAGPTRRDRILISSDLAAIESDYETKRAFELSDHALHWALLDKAGSTREL